MRFEPLKQWLTPKSQLMLLQERGLIVSDERRALHYLQTLSYYRLSGYFYPFRELKDGVRDNIFIKNSRFDDVLSLYLFDKGLRLLAFDALERIEMAIRTDIAHTLGGRHPNAHEIPEHLDFEFTQRFYDKKYSQKSAHQKWLDKYDGLVARSKRQDFIAHHLDKYGKLPIWVACEILDFGALSHLYSGMKPKDRQKIATKYHTNERLFVQWLRSLNFIRNVVAHHGRLWNLNIVERSDLHKLLVGFDKQLENHKAFGYFYLMSHLLSVISPTSTWRLRLINHIRDNFPKVNNNAISLDDFGYLEEIGEMWLPTDIQNNTNI